MSKCCGHLEQVARDPRVPIKYVTETDTFTLHLSDSISVPSMFCTFCGGFGFEGRQTARRPCTCNRLISWAKDPSIPIRFDRQLNEFLLVLNETRIEDLLYFCPACGGRLPDSKRDELFTTPSKDDFERLHALIRQVDSIDEAINILGEPDRRVGPTLASSLDKEIYGISDIKQTLFYDNLSSTTCLVLQEREDGTMCPSFCGHRRDRRST